MWHDCPGRPGAAFWGQIARQRDCLRYNHATIRVSESTISEPTLHQEVAQALVGDVDPERLESFRFAQGILPVFDLIRALFSQNLLDTCLKLMLLHELSRAGGRSTIDRIRSMAAFLDPARVDGLVDSLKKGGWLELRAVDNSYVPSLVGVNLLSLLAAADLGNLSPQNALARAAQNAEFGARLDGARTPLSLLLDQLHVLIEDRVEEARQVLQLGRPARMIAWSQQEHAAQLHTIRGVLETLSGRLDAASREFSRIVRLHEVIQELVRMHTGIHTRLQAWNLEQLYSSEAGYSLTQLAEAVMGAPEATLESLHSTGILQITLPPPTLSTEEVAARFHGARRRLPDQSQAFVYVAPILPLAEPLEITDLDPAAALRSHLSRCFADHPGPLELEQWMTADFGTAIWELSLLCRLEAEGPHFLLDDGRSVRVQLPDGVNHKNFQEWLATQMCSVGRDRYSRITLHLQEAG